eukprot:357808-Chlamydomonas_euryale.AAC.4
MASAFRTDMGGLRMYRCCCGTGAFEVGGMRAWKVQAHVPSNDWHRTLHGCGKHGTADRKSGQDVPCGHRGGDGAAACAAGREVEVPAEPRPAGGGGVACADAFRADAAAEVEDTASLASPLQAAAAAAFFKAATAAHV